MYVFTIGHLELASVLTPISLDHLAVISITSNVECCLGMIACSLPPLRKLFKFYYGSSHEGNYQITGEVSHLQCRNL
jgi:hypothetical protein